MSGSTSNSGIGSLPGVNGVNGGSGPGVKGVSSGGAALYGLAASNSEGLYAQSGATAGYSPGGTRNGVHGVTNSPADSGVWGEAVAGGYGVSGSTNSSGTNGSAGVYGANLGSGPGVLGQGGVGVHGVTSSGGMGVLAENASSSGGVALQVVGVSAFNRSGRVSITGSSTSATVYPPGGLTSQSLVIALLQNSVPGIWVVSAVPNTSTGAVTISLNAAPGLGVTAQVGFFVVN